MILATIKKKLQRRKLDSLRANITNIQEKIENFRIQYENCNLQMASFVELVNSSEESEAVKEKLYIEIKRLAEAADIRARQIIDDLGRERDVMEQRVKDFIQRG